MLAILTMLDAPGAHCAWLRVAPLLPSPLLRAVAQVLPGRGGKAGLPIELESSAVWDRFAPFRNCFSSPRQAGPSRNAKPPALCSDPPEAGRMSGCPPSRQFFAATVRRERVKGMTHDSAARSLTRRPLTAPSNVAPPN